MKVLLLLCAVFMCFGHAHARDTVRICTYHLLNYSPGNEDGRAVQFKKVVEQIAPDILAVQDINGQDAALGFFTDALDPQIWSLATYTDGPDTDNMLYFKFDRFAFLDVVHHPTALRSISEYRLLLKSTNDTITVIAVHFTSGDTGADADARNDEAIVIQTRIMELMQKADRNVVVCGNFNFYSTAEPGYIRLVLFDSSFLLDPVPGWLRNDEAFASLYTQSTRTTGDGDCGGGVGGGMDDRFDMLLFSPAMYERHVEGSYTAYGNDGQPRLNQSIDEPANTAVPAEIAAALRCASDHLPVYADIVFDTPTDVAEQRSGFGANIYPMPVAGQGSIEIVSSEPRTLTVLICDVAGRRLAAWDVAIEAGRRMLSLPALPAGVYMCRILGAGRPIALPFVVVR